MVIPGLQSSTARGAVPIRSHHLVWRVLSPQHQLWGRLGSIELPLMTTGTGAAANPEPSSAGFPSMGQALGCLCCPSWEGEEGIPAGMPQIPLLLILAKFSAFSKQFPHLRINPLNATAKQNKPENPSLHPQPDGKPLDVPCPHLLFATGPGHHPDVTVRGLLLVELQVWRWHRGGRGH